MASACLPTRETRVVPSADGPGVGEWLETYNYKFFYSSLADDPLRKFCQFNLVIHPLNFASGS